MKFNKLNKVSKLLARYNLDYKYPQEYGEEKNFEDKFFVNENDKDVENWCKNQDPEIEFDEGGEIINDW